MAVAKMSEQVRRRLWKGREGMVFVCQEEGGGG